MAAQRLTPHGELRGVVQSVLAQSQLAEQTGFTRVTYQHPVTVRQHLLQIDPNRVGRQAGKSKFLPPPPRKCSLTMRQSFSKNLSI
jgi:hypothetical protein